MIASLMGGAASVSIFLSADAQSALSPGSLTGPFSQLALIGSAFLMVGATAQFWRARAGLAASLLGLALSSPLFSWRFAAGAWCSALGHCRGEYPTLQFEPYSALCITLALLSIALQSTHARGPTSKVR
jgi:hypothetical protein